MGYGVLSKYRSELMGIAMLWVMLFHAWDLDLGSSLLNNIRAAGFGGVDIFIVLSAMGLVMSLNRRDQEFSQFMSRRAKRILPAYFLVMIPFTLFSIWRGNADWASLIWNSTLLNYWVQAKGSFNWYVSGIMLFYALTPFFFSKLKKTKHRECWVICGVLLSLLCCRILISCGYWGHLDVPYRFPLFFLGLLLGFYVWEKRTLRKKDIFFWCISAVAGGMYLVISSKANEVGIYLPLCHLFLFTTIPMCFFACLCFEQLPLGWIRKFLRLIGENSLEIYLINVSFFSETALLQSLFPFGPTHRLFYLMLFALNIALGILIHQGVARLLQRTI